MTPCGRQGAIHCLWRGLTGWTLPSRRGRITSDRDAATGHYRCPDAVRTHSGRGIVQVERQ